jgi:MFS family permease
MSRFTSRAPALLVAICVAIAVIGLNTTATNVAARGMADPFDLSLDDLSWVVAAFLVSAAACSLVGGRLGDVIGRLWTFIMGATLLFAGSVVAATAPAAWALVVGRILQGVGAGLVLPSTIELTVAFAPPETRGRGFRARAVTYACAFGVGPLVGGVLTDTLGWRALFALEAVLAGIALAIAVALRDRRSGMPVAPTRDWRGALLSMAAIALFMVGAGRMRVWGWVPWPTGAVAAALVALLAALVWVESHTPHPLIHRSLWRDRVVMGANLATIGASVGMIGLIYFFAALAQSAAVFASTGLAAATALGTFTATIVAFALLSGRLSRRFGFSAPVLTGLVISVAGFLWLSTTTVGTTEGELLVPLSLCGFGAGIANGGLVAPAVFSTRLTRVDEAAGLTSLSRFFGSAIAVVIGTSTYLAVAVRDPGVESAPIVDASVSLGAGAYQDAVDALRADLRVPFEAATRAQTVQAFATTMRLTALLVAVLAALSFWLLRGARPQTLPAAELWDPPTPRM